VICLSTPLWVKSTGMFVLNSKSNSVEEKRKNLSFEYLCTAKTVGN